MRRSFVDRLFDDIRNNLGAVVWALIVMGGLAVYTYAKLTNRIENLEQSAQENRTTVQEIRSDVRFIMQHMMRSPTTTTTTPTPKEQEKPEDSNSAKPTKQTTP